ncbi:hypothetical protein J3R83DRAFT_4970 [Lanmaoa asiatica]|nr:hypothetical protein J3R83DRAFT_4970 [Lanmaoa asiatica]
MAVPQKYWQLGDFYKYYTGEKVAPVLTVVIGGNHEASNYFWELYHGGWLAPNIYFLGRAGCIQCPDCWRFKITTLIKVITSACRMIMVRCAAYAMSRSIIFFACSPSQISFSHATGLDQLNGNLGSPPLMGLLQTLRPDWWVSAYLHVRFEAVVKHRGGEQGLGEGNPPVVPANPDQTDISDEDVDERS